MSNSISFVGNLGRDAESKEVGSTSVTEFNVANSVGFGEKKSTMWFRCAVWGKRGETLLQYLTKGTKVYIAGELNAREYTNKDGDAKTSLDVRVDQLDLCGKAEGGANSAPTPQQSAPQAPENDPDLPF